MIRTRFDQIYFDISREERHARLLSDTRGGASYAGRTALVDVIIIRGTTLLVQHGTTENPWRHPCNVTQLCETELPFRQQYSLSNVLLMRNNSFIYLHQKYSVEHAVFFGSYYSAALVCL